MEKQHWHVRQTWNKDMQHGFAVWTCSMNMHNENVAYTCSRGMQQTCSMDIRHRYEART